MCTNKKRSKQTYLHICAKKTNNIIFITKFSMAHYKNTIDQGCLVYIKTLFSHTATCPNI